MSKTARRGSLYRRGGMWWTKIMVDGKMIYQSLNTTNKGEAERAQASFVAPLLAGEKVDTLAAIVNRLDVAKVEAARMQDEANPPLTLSEAWAAYLESEERPRRAGDRTLADYAGNLAAFTSWMKVQYPSAVYLRDVTVDMAAGFIRHLGAQGCSGNRVNKYLQFLRTMFKVLAEPGRISTNPFAKFKRREHLGHTKRPLTIEELKRIIETAEGEMKTLFMLGTFTGLRLGDAATLQWGETDLARAIIRRVPHKTARTGKAVIIGIPSILGHHLAGLKCRGHYILPETAATYGRDQSTLCKRIQQHFKKCGIQTVMPGTGGGTKKRAVVLAGFHSLRHSFISMHAQAGTSQAVMQKLAGHSNPMMTEHYTHIDESTARATAAALPSIIGEASPALHPIDWKTRIRELAEKLTAKNGLKIKQELLALAEA